MKMIKRVNLLSRLFTFYFSVEPQESEAFYVPSYELIQEAFDLVKTGELDKEEIEQYVMADFN